MADAWIFRRPDIKDDEIYHLYFDLGWSTSQIAKKFNCNKTSVANRIHANGWEMRHPSPVHGYNRTDHPLYSRWQNAKDEWAANWTSP